MRYADLFEKIDRYGPGELLRTLSPQARRALPDRIRYFDMREADHETHLVARKQGKIAGIAGLQENPYNPEELWVKFVSVTPKFQQQGIAGQLVDGIMQYAQEHGYTVKRSSPTDMGAKYLPSVWQRAQERYPEVTVKGSDEV